MNKTRIHIYTELCDKYHRELQVVISKHTKISFLRLATFLAVFISWFYIFTTVNKGVGAFLGIVLIVAFLILLKFHKRIEEKRNYLEAILKINKNELGCCQGDFSVFESGNEYIDHNHPYSYDIDLFGNGSFFQFINRTVTIKGKQLLALWLRNTPLASSDILNNQNAINELTEALDFRQKFQVVGELFKSESEEEGLVKSWLESNTFFARVTIVKIVAWILPLLSLSIIVSASFGIIGVKNILWIMLLNLGVIGIRLKEFNKYNNLLNKSHLVLKKIALLVSQIEAYDCKSELLADLKGRLIKDGLKASSQIGQLTKLINGLDNRNNMLLGFVLNGFLLWDWQYVIRIEKWRINHKIDFSNWLESIAYFDALISCSNLAYNNPEFNYPEITDSEFVLKAEAIGHPLIANDLRVCNDFEITAAPRYAIVTGANMAGKSTFLRTVAINLVLAGCGAPVCAKNMKLMPLPLHSSMRAEDSLLDNESYFFAELKRLQKITKALDKGEKLFIILDEILRGTNSEDKRKGSIGFVKKITEKMAHGLVATHDLELARLAEQKPDVFKALCFEVEIIDDDLKFDYKLQPGVTQNMNASFLMKQMGIIDN